uniref:Uncharacterized protein n=1 Tax=Anguilla anguilla TaxID=7936 RepID=A0A0E9X0E8_ANGAN
MKSGVVKNGKEPPQNKRKSLGRYLIYRNIYFSIFLCGQIVPFYDKLNIFALVLRFQFNISILHQGHLTGRICLGKATPK